MNYDDDYGSGDEGGGGGGGDGGGDDDDDDGCAADDAGDAYKCDSYPDGTVSGGIITLSWRKWHCDSLPKMFPKTIAIAISCMFIESDSSPKGISPMCGLKQFLTSFGTFDERLLS